MEGMARFYGAGLNTGTILSSSPVVQVNMEPNKDWMRLSLWAIIAALSNLVGLMVYSTDKVFCLFSTGCQEIVEYKLMASELLLMVLVGAIYLQATWLSHHLAYTEVKVDILRPWSRELKKMGYGCIGWAVVAAAVSLWYTSFNILFLGVITLKASSMLGRQSAL